LPVINAAVGTLSSITITCQGGVYSVVEV
jgi:hypothetical protein